MPKAIFDEVYVASDIDSDAGVESGGPALSVFKDDLGSADFSQGDLVAVGKRSFVVKEVVPDSQDEIVLFFLDEV